jgi:multicomponent Na+:H+ antiporter subunit D
MDTSLAILLSMLLPATAVVANLIFRNSPNLRDGLTLGAAIATFLVVLNILAWHST